MKLTNNDLRRIIKEELNAVLRETGDSENVNIPQTIIKLHNLTSKGSGQLTTIPDEKMIFLDDEERELENFSVSDAIEQLRLRPVKRRNKTLKPWKTFEISRGFFVEDVKGFEQDYPNLSQAEEVFLLLQIERPENLSFRMQVILESGEEPKILEIQGQNVDENLEEILSYFVIPKEDILEMANELIRFK